MTANRAVGLLLVVAADRGCGVHPGEIYKKTKIGSFVSKPSHPPLASNLLVVLLLTDFAVTATRRSEFLS